jgi:GNAT superfamily N-acetyltransferase
MRGSIAIAASLGAAVDGAELEIERGDGGDADRLVALFDDAIAWLVARRQTAQWGSEPWSADPAKVERTREWAQGGGLWLAVDGAGTTAGAIVLGDAHDYVPPPDRPELYVQVLLTAASHRGRGVGARLVAHAVAQARAAGAEQLRVDCWAGVPGLPAAYERLGFTRTGSFTVKDWPGAILVRPVG